MKNLLNKKILFIICGGISAYKSLETIRLFKKNGAEIKTILTNSAKEFVTPLSVASLSQGKVYTELFSIENETEMDHIALSRWADVILIAPATANTISKLAQGTTDDLASTVVLASDKDSYLSTAINVRMWEHLSTKQNLNKLKNFEFTINQLKLSEGWNKKLILKDLAIVISPYAPFITEELWSKLGETESISKALYPEFNPSYLVENAHIYPVSFNGKMRFTLSLSLALDKEAIQQAVLDDPRTTEYLDGKAPKKWIVVPNKIINIVF